jgi:hypothetical protein
MGACQTQGEEYMTDHTAIQETNEMKKQWAKHIEQGAPKREWVGLTDDEILDLWIANHKDTGATDAFARAIEAKLKEKNT